MVVLLEVNFESHCGVGSYSVVVCDGAKQGAYDILLVFFLCEQHVYCVDLAEVLHLSLLSLKIGSVTEVPHHTRL